MKYPLRSKNPTVSLCMIVRDEEAYLGECLQSVVDVVDEIVAVDTGSTDGTIEILQEFGAQVHKLSWTDDFAAARNQAIKYARCDWIFQIDADERLLPESKQAFRKALKEPHALAVGVLIDSPKTEGKGHISRAHRLFRNVAGIRYSGRIHEQISPSVIKLNGKETDSNIRLRHLGYCKSESAMQAKSARNFRLLTAQVEEEPDNPYWHFTLAQNQILSDNYSGALVSLNRALQLGTLPNDIRCSIFNNLAEVYMRLERYDEAVKSAQRALWITKQQATSHLLLFQIYGHLSNGSEQIRCLEAVLRLEENKKQNLNKVSLEAYVDETAVRLNLGRLYFEASQFEAALATFNKVWRLDRQNVAAIQGKGEAALALGRFDEARISFEEFVKHVPKEAPALEKLAWLYIKAQQFEKAASCYRKLLELEPGNQKIKKRLAALYYKLGKVTQGKALLQF